MQDQEDIIKVPLSSLPQNKGKKFFSSFDQLSKEYKDKFQSDLEITGSVVNNPLHSRPSLKGEAFDIRNKNLSPEQQQWIDSRSSQLGLKVLTASGKEKWATGPHKHIQESDEIRIPLEQLKTNSVAAATTNPTITASKPANAFQNLLSEGEAKSKDITKTLSVLPKTTSPLPPSTSKKKSLGRYENIAKVGDYVRGIIENYGPTTEEGGKHLLNSAKNTLDMMIKPGRFFNDLSLIGETIPGELVKAQLSPLQTAENIRKEKGLSLIESWLDPEILGHSGLALIPMFGPLASKMSIEVKEGRYKEASQTAIAMALPFIHQKLKIAKESNKLKGIKIEESKTDAVTTYDDSSNTIYINPIKIQEAIKEGRNPAALIEEGINHELGHVMVDAAKTSQDPIIKENLKAQAEKTLSPKKAEEFNKTLDNKKEAPYNSEEKVVEDITITGEALKRQEQSGFTEAHQEALDDLINRPSARPTIEQQKLLGIEAKARNESSGRGVMAEEGDIAIPLDQIKQPQELPEPKSLPENEPPISEGHTRLYRGTSGPSKNLPSSMAADEYPIEFRGRWFSTDKNYARAFSKSDKDLTYVDIPTRELSKYKGEGIPGTEGLYQESGKEFLYPPYEERHAGLNPVAAIREADNLNIGPLSSNAPSDGGSFQTYYKGSKGYSRQLGSPNSRAGQPGQYEINDPIGGKQVSDAFKNAEYNVKDLEDTWKKSTDEINHNLDLAFREESGGKTLYPKGLKKLIGKENRDSFTKDFIDIIEKPFDDPSRQEIKSSQSPLGEALRQHDNLTEQWRQYILSTQRQLGREVPDDWGVTERGYYRHLFLGDVQVFQDGKFIGVAPTYAEAQRIAFETWKTNPEANITAKARNIFNGDPSVRLTNSRFWGLLGKVTKTISENNPLIEITSKELRDDFVGIIGREAAKQKSLGALFKREGYEGYSKDYSKVMQMHATQLAHSQEISKLNNQLQPIREAYIKAGMNGMAEDIQAHLNHVWGKPTPQELRFGEWIRKTPSLRNTVANPDYALSSLAWKLGRLNNFLILDYNLRSTTVNGLQSLTTLWPYTTTKQLASYMSQMTKPSTWKRLNSLGVLEGKSKVELGAPKHLTPFSAMSEFNRGVGYLHGEIDAVRLGLKGQEAHRWAMDWAERVEFNNTKWNVAPVLRSPIGKLLGQYKGYLFKDVENIAQSFRESSVEPNSRLLRGSKQIGARLATGGLNTVLKATPFVAGYKIVQHLSSKLQSLGIDKKTSDEISEATLYGSPSLIGLDLSGSFSLVDFIGNSPQEMAANFALGPTLSRGLKLGQQLSSNSPEKAVKTLTPYSKAIDLPKAIIGEKTTTDLDANTKTQISRYEAIMEALGFTLKKKSKFFDMKEAKVNPRTGEPMREKRKREEKREIQIP